MDGVNLKRVLLKNVIVKRNEKYSKGPWETQYKSKITIDYFKDSNLMILVSHIMNFYPEGPFKIEIEVGANYKLKKDYKQEIIESNLKELAIPILPYITLYIATLSNMLGCIPPLIIPPFLEDEEENAENSGDKFKELKDDDDDDGENTCGEIVNKNTEGTDNDDI